VEFEKATILYADLSGSTDLVNAHGWTFAAEIYKAYVLVGAKPIRHDGFRSVISNDAPVAMRETILQRTTQILSFYRARLGTPPEQTPLVVVKFTDTPGKNGVFRGDVTPNGVAFLRIQSDVSQVAEPRLIARYTGFLAHELFHLWNRSGDADDANWWLAEGGAEYASWVAASKLWPNEASLETRIDTALRSCSMYLGASALSNLADPDRRSVRYPCGAVVQWMSDVGVRAARSDRDVFEIWKQILATRKTQGAYRPVDWRKAVGELAPGAAPSIGSILDGGGTQRWVSIAHAIDTLGAEIVVSEPAPFLQRLAAAQALVQSACGEVYGVGDDQRGLFVQAPEGCAVFGGESSVLASVEGVAPMADPKRFYQVTQTRCENGSQVTVMVGPDSAQHSAAFKCSVAVQPPPPELKVVHALPST
jgi:hypothetical protein